MEVVRACVDDGCLAETQHVCWVAVTFFLSDTCHYSFHFCHFKRHILQSPLGPLRFTSGSFQILQEMDAWNSESPSFGIFDLCSCCACFGI